MEFNAITKSIFEIIDMEPIPVNKTTSLKEELDVDSLQMVNLMTRLAETFDVPFARFIEHADLIDTMGGIYQIITGEVKS
ncbi:acyl carrier protein [Pullulanibacillus pueri]|uniref:Carrier domain-containing protein n=1 Tax=Pullulanibacillus pueri TaxID=1437324 RepID=A0A8J2ZXH4_9BACL|nr:acyl carrier protein [Pullulanibacillus pueri]MBM7682792.1 acyl carrier protein [Pullulanibacillus pueri]GGH83202.1 hypothetical protein GCM10007096_23720 [Pullulanibacillus pueri]